MTNVNELARVILVVFTLAATGIAFCARGELGFSLPKAFSGFVKTTSPMSFFLGSSTDSRPQSIHRDDPKEPLPVALSFSRDSLTRVVPHVISGSGSKTARKKGLSSWGAPEKLSAPPDAAHPGLKAELSASAHPQWMDLGVKFEEVKNWFVKRDHSSGSSFSDAKAVGLVKLVMILLMVLALVGLPLGLKAFVRHGESSEVVVDVKPGSPLKKVPQSPAVPSDDDIMGAFDAFDHRRLGFIDRATVNHMLGHMTLPGHLDAAAPFLGSVKKLFYEDFRRLAQQPGPFADAVMERAVKQRQKMPSASTGQSPKRGGIAGALDKLSKIGFDVDAAHDAISQSADIKKDNEVFTCWSQLQPDPQQPCTDTHSNEPSPRGGGRSWSELRAQLAPKASLSDDENQKDKQHYTRMRRHFDEAVLAERAGVRIASDRVTQMELEFHEDRNQQEEMVGESASKMSLCEQLKSELERRKNRSIMS